MNGWRNVETVRFIGMAEHQLQSARDDAIRSDAHPNDPHKVLEHLSLALEAVTSAIEAQTAFMAVKS